MSSGSGSDIRDKSLALLTSTLESVSSSSSSGGGATSSQASALESAIFDKHNDDSGNDYRNEVRYLSLDLGKNNTDLGRRVADGSVTAEQVVHMSTEQLKTSSRAAEDAEMKEQGLQDSLGEQRIPTEDIDGQALGSSTLTQGVVGRQDESMGEEGDFKLRGQPKIQGLEGIEFESGF